MVFYDKQGRPMGLREKLDSLAFRARYFLARFIPALRPSFQRGPHVGSNGRPIIRYVSPEERDYMEKALRWVPGIVSTAHPDPDDIDRYDGGQVYGADRTGGTPGE